MKNALFTDMLRRIKKTKGRFFSIMAIIAIGCGFFAGVKVTSPDMKNTADLYYKDKNLMDIRLVSTFGFDDDEISQIKNSDNEINGISGGYSADMFLLMKDGTSEITRVYSADLSLLNEKSSEYISRFTLLEGRLPEKPNECLIEANTPDEYDIGDTLTLSSGDTETDTSDILDYDTFTVTGKISWVKYVDFERGTTTIGNGSIGSYLVIPDEAFAYEYYTDVYITYLNTAGMDSFDEEYKAFIEHKTDELEKLCNRIHSSRLGEISDEITDAEKELADGKAEYNDGVEEYESSISEAEDEIAKADEEIADAEQKLVDGEKEYNDAVNTFNAEISKAQKDLDNAQWKITQSEKELADGRQKYEEGMSAYNSGAEELKRGKEELSAKEAMLENEAAQLEAAKAGLDSLAGFTEQMYTASLPEDSEQLTALVNGFSAFDTPELSVSETAFAYAVLSPDDPQKTVLKGVLESVCESMRVKLTEAQNTISSARTEISAAWETIKANEELLNASHAELVSAEARLNEGARQLESGKAELEKGRREFYDKKAQGEKELLNARQEIDDGKAELEKARTELLDAKEEFEEKRLEGKEELEKAKTELDDGQEELLEAREDFDELTDNLKWYVFDRDSNTGYASFGEDADRVDSIARIFPIFFILVAALVCLNTMTRMVEEQRTEIGTLKALGYNNFTIIAQYLFYSAAASIIGSVAGLLIGFNLFPRVIFEAYRLMYDYPDVICTFRMDYAAGCILVSLLCTCASSVWACIKELNGQPAQLMRPKPPKNGKRVLLERIPLIWKKLSFNAAVTIRNISRYKSRVLMTVIGIGGCTALMLTGFGLRNAISVIVDLQFGEIIKYDTLCTFSEEDNEKYELLKKNISETDSVTEYMFGMQKSVTVKCNGKQKEAYAIVPENPSEISSFITLRRRLGRNAEHKKSDIFSINDEGVIINEKLAKLLGGIKAGDEIAFEDTDVKAVVTAVTENYSQNYVYFTPELYRSVFGEYDNNIFYLNIEDNADTDAISKEILENTQVTSVNFMEHAGDTFRQLIKSLNAIVYVIIGSSGALAFVVLYNLSNINISERIRELATIKVLGFYDVEVASYVYRENTVSALLGMGAGLFGGIFLNRFVVNTAEVDVVMFYPDIPLSCFVFAALLTLVFTLSVNAMLYIKLKDIDMAGSLKAIE